MTKKINNKDTDNINRFLAVLDKLSHDFESICYIDVRDKKLEDAVKFYRTSDDMKRLVPELDTESIFTKRLDILLRDFVAEEEKDRFYAMTRREAIFKATANGTVYCVKFMAAADGEKCYFQMRFSPVLNDRNEIIALVCGIKNIDEDIKRDIAVKRQLEIADKANRNFLFKMSHDIRTPLNAVLGFAELAEKNIDNRERVADCLKKIDVAGRQLLVLMDEVLSMSRIEAGVIKSELKPVNIQEEIAKLMIIFSQTAAERGIMLSCHTDNIINPRVIADELHINQTLINVLTNAVNFTGRGGRVDITVSQLQSQEKKNGRYCFVIEDTGVGMSQEFAARIFDNFSRENNEALRDVQGIGLGMAVVKRLVDHMNGTIDIETEKDRGTKIVITIELQIEDNAAANIRSAEIDLRGRRILLVEDNELNREIARELLEDQGVLVEEAVNGLEAVQCAASHKPGYYDVILMDIQMPLMNGYEATEEIRRLPEMNKQVIIALSANAFEEDRCRAIKAGMTDHVAKPFDITELMETMQRLLKA